MFWETPNSFFFPSRLTADLRSIALNVFVKRDALCRYVHVYKVTDFCVQHKDMYLHVICLHVFIYINAADDIKNVTD
jgi:hypothetical protein